MSKSELKALCRGNRTDRGWAETPEGNWVPSVHDRRRVAVAEMGMACEAMGVPGLPGPMVVSVLRQHATDGTEDLRAMVENFQAWFAGTRG